MTMTQTRRVILNAIVAIPLAVGWSTPAFASHQTAPRSQGVNPTAIYLPMAFSSYTPIQMQHAIAMGSTHACAITPTGGILCWGNNSAGELGSGARNDDRVPVPIQVQGLTEPVIAITAGEESTCALTGAGGIKCWGSNDFGELGNGQTQSSYIPVDVIGLKDGASAVEMGGSTACTITLAGGVKCWGRNFDGQLGDGSTQHRSSPVDVKGLPGGVVQIGVGDGHACAVTSSGQVWCWGDNEFGQLGDGATSDRHLPVAVTALPEKAVSISLGRRNTCVVTVSGGVLCWGENEYAQDGDGTTTLRTIPVSVNGLAEKVRVVSIRLIHTCVLTESGSVECWGSNYRGALGIGGTDGVEPSPMQVTGLPPEVSAISAGDFSTCVLTATHAALCWGANNFGELGDGTLDDRSFPLPVIGLP
jgi:alpha-tubulin suppressor-like RCC1 family protein